MTLEKKKETKKVFRFVSTVAMLGKTETTSSIREEYLKGNHYF